MKKILKLTFIFITLLIIGKGNVLADAVTDYFDTIFANNQFTIYTNVTINSDDTLLGALNRINSYYSIQEYWTSNENHSNASLAFSDCNYSTMKANFTVIRNKTENGIYSSENLKTYSNVSLIVNNQIDNKFPMLNNGVLTIHNDEDLCTTPRDRSNCVSNELNNYTNNNLYWYVNETDSNNILIYRIERSNNKVTNVYIRTISNIIFSFDNNYTNEYYDGLFTNNQFKVYTDAVVSNDNTLSTAIENVISNNSVTEYSNSSDDYSRLYLYYNNCKYDTMTCNFVVSRSKGENGQHSISILKIYKNISISIDNNINTYFPMVTNGDFVINYDESLFSSDSEKQNYINTYLSNKYSSYSEDIQKTYSYYQNRIVYTERSNEYDDISINPLVTKVVSKTVNNVVFEYTDEPMSDNFKKVAPGGQIIIKADSNIVLTKTIVQNYIWSLNFTNLSFQLEGDFKDNKAIIKMTDYSDNDNQKTEQHLVTVLKDENIDLNLFDRIGCRDYMDIAVDEPSDKSTFFINYANSTSYSFYSDDNDYYYIDYDELNFLINPDYAILKYQKKNYSTGQYDIQYHQVHVRFVGYNNNYSEKYLNQIGKTVFVHADSISLNEVNEALNYRGRVLACYNNYSSCDIGYFDYATNSLEIHKVNIIIDSSMSEEFKKIFNIKEDNSFDIIKDSNIKNLSLNTSSYYYDQKTQDNYEYRCNSYETNDNSKCKLIINNYNTNKHESHLVTYNIINRDSSDFYSSVVKDSIDVYPGESPNIFNRLSWSSGELFRKQKNFNNIRSIGCESSNKRCKILIRNSDNNLEVHYSQVNVKEGKSPKFDSLFPGDTLKLSSIYKDDADYIYYVSYAYLMSKTRTYSWLNNYNDTNRTAKVNFDDYETHTMKLEFAEGNSEDKKVVDDVIDKIGDQGIKIILDDLEFVNRFYYEKVQNESEEDEEDEEELRSNYNSQKVNDIVKKLINNKKVTYFLVEDGGCGDEYFEEINNRLLLFYNGIGYGVSDAEIITIKRDVLFVPDDTQNTPEAFVKAAQKRIDDYLGKNSGVTISFEEPITDRYLDDNEYFKDINFDKNKYIIKYKNNERELILAKGSDKMQTATFNAIDINNNITVSSNNAIYPTNTIVAGEKVNISKYKDIFKKLGIKDADIFDINLYSPTIGDIEEFNNVDFDVEVPIDLTKFKSNKLIALYIDDNGNIEKHELKADDFFGRFKTSHFSTYIITEDNETINKLIKSGNPTTGDSILSYVVYLFISCGLIIYIRKRVNS